VTISFLKGSLVHELHSAVERGTLDAVSIFMFEADEWKRFIYTNLHPLFDV